MCSAALAVRIPALGFGLPDLVHPDEPTNMAIGVAMSDHHRWNPMSFAYPSMMYDMIDAVRSAQRLVFGATPLGIVTQNLGINHTSDPGLFVAVRSVVMVISTGLCALLWWITSRITGNWWAATLAGLTVALSPLMVANGVYITPDTLSAFFTAIALGGALLILHRGRVSDYVIAGIGVGLAAAAKYNAASVLIALLMAHILYYRQDLWRWGAARRLVLAGAVAALAFVAITPAALFTPHLFYSEASQQLHIYQTGHAGVAGSSFRFYLNTLHHDSFLWLIALVVAVAALLSRWRRDALILTVFVVFYLILISAQTVHFARDALPLIPALAMLLGIGTAVVSETITQRSSPWAAGAVVALAGTIFLVSPSIASAKVSGILDEHPRAEARAWIEAHIPNGSQIVIESYGPWMPPGRYRLVSPPFAVLGGSAPGGATALVLAQNGSGRYLSDPAAFPSEMLGYRNLLRTWCPATSFTNGPWIRVYTPCQGNRAVIY